MRIESWLTAILRAPGRPAARCRTSLPYFAGPLGSRAEARADDAWQTFYERAVDMDVPVEEVTAPAKVWQSERLEVLATELHEFLFSIRGKSDEQAGRELRT